MGGRQRPKHLCKLNNSSRPKYDQPHNITPLYKDNDALSLSLHLIEKEHGRQKRAAKFPRKNSSEYSGKKQVPLEDINQRQKRIFKRKTIFETIALDGLAYCLCHQKSLDPKEIQAKHCYVRNHGKGYCKFFRKGGNEDNLKYFWQ